MQKKNIFVIVIIIILIITFVVVTRNSNTLNVVDVQKTENTTEGVMGNKDDLVSLSLLPNQQVSGKMKVTGSVKGAYFFEANILVNILDINKNVLKKGYATATSDWMTVEPVQFEGEIDFTGLPQGSAYIEIHNDNASGLPEHDKSILIPIIIK